MLVDILSFVFLLLFIGLALFGGLVLVALLFGPSETERQRIKRETREAERQVSDYGRRAQAAILAEALRQVERKRGSGHGYSGSNEPV